MRADNEIHSLPVSCLPLRSRELLTCLLDTPKTIPTDGPEKLPRDWRGLAYLVNVSSEKAAYIQMRPNKTIEVLDIWQQDCTATVGQLLNHLVRLDRYDVHDDLTEDLREAMRRGELVVNRQNQIAINNNNNNSSNSNQEQVFRAITYDDRPGHEQHYDAFVLYAKEDKAFVNELLERMRAEGFQLCTEDSLQAGHMTPYAPVAQLISERCQRIILVCSPEFLSSQANTFYRDYAQAVSIESSYHKIIPIMYRECQLPSHLAFYHKLYYNEDEERAMYDFWLKLKQSLELARVGGASRLRAAPPAPRLPARRAPAAAHQHRGAAALLLHQRLPGREPVPPLHAPKYLHERPGLPPRRLHERRQPVAVQRQPEKRLQRREEEKARQTDANPEHFKTKEIEKSHYGRSLAEFCQTRMDINATSLQAC
ncbi:unnamed protein product [Chrysodeixis includens]|uniref:Myeloid differentiation primary response protein MyD88 n=1 Tax=Chrysodeixis includens TaxID=689277 RepID=A0A9P0C2J5_CHRIL|nr:unnamed protein product [Chrysodeixis includens]